MPRGDSTSSCEGGGARVPPPSLPEGTTRMPELSSSRPRRHRRSVGRSDELSGTELRTLLGRGCTRLIVLVALVVLPSLVRPQESSPLQQSPIDDYTIRVTVEEVVLHATAQNRKGALVSGLGKEEFQVYEDGVPQEIKHFSHEDIPVTVGLVVDNSGSMRPKRADVIAAALAFVRSSNPMDQMFVVTFNEKVSFGLPDICRSQTMSFSWGPRYPESPQMVRRRCTTRLLLRLNI